MKVGMGRYRESVGNANANLRWYLAISTARYTRSSVGDVYGEKEHQDGR